MFDESQFADTIVRLFDDGVWIDIIPTSHVDVGRVGVVAPGVIHVISGCNPGVLETEDVNAQRHLELETRLRGMGIDPQPAIGRSPDGAWVEPSWAVIGVSRAEICAVGREFGQVAVFAIDADHIYVVACADGEIMTVRPYSVGSCPTVRGPA